MMDIDARLSSFAFKLREQQFEALVSVLNQVKQFALCKKFIRFRPNVPIKGNAKVWWKYACNSCSFFFFFPSSLKRINFFLIFLVKSIQSVYRPIPVFSPKFLAWRRQQRIDYLRLFKLKLKDEITPEQEKQLQEIELNISYYDIHLYNFTKHFNYF